MRRILLSSSFSVLFVMPAALLAQPVPPAGERQDPALAGQASVTSPSVEPETPEEAPVVVVGEREEVVCRREKPTGSRVATKVCRTEKSLREEQLATQEVMTELQLAGGPVFDSASGLVGADVDGNPQTVPSANPF
ncbi:hypothetical protein [Sphingomicrobium flavum]|uniref:hypothetical protein n=1 Tax=Sphingomicrobium flavum TaxID=1229164 RepID=UPI0021ADB0CA|nr:hypothetical protein [Sphingomicrobium flavum]